MFVFLRMIPSVRESTPSETPTFEQLRESSQSRRHAGCTCVEGLLTRAFLPMARAHEHVSRSTLHSVVTVVGLLVFVVGFLQLLACLSSVLRDGFSLGQCWSEFLLALVGALVFTR